jgi:hypothetical protein
LFFACGGITLSLGRRPADEPANRIGPRPSSGVDIWPTWSHANSGCEVSAPIGSPMATRRQHAAAGRVRIVGANSISLNWGSTTEIVRWCDVVFAHSVRNHTEIVTHGGTLKVHCSLSALIATLAELGLVQVRRDVAVNAVSVRRLLGSGRHRLVAVLEGGVCVPVGREFQRDIRARFTGSGQSLRVESV